jgi:ribokinase
MSRLAVVGNINIETSLLVEAFPIPYSSATFVPFGIESGLSGVGYNIARALAALGDDVTLVTVVGQDRTAAIIRDQLRADGLDDRFVVTLADRSAQSIVAYDSTGQRTTFVDLKDLMSQTYPVDLFEQVIAGTDAVLFTQIAYCRPLLAHARAAQKLIAVDLQLYDDLNDEYKRPFLETCAVTFMSGENLRESPEQWTSELLEKFPVVQIVGIGLGAEGAFVAERASGLMVRVPPLEVRPVVNSSGAGDALFSCFMHYYLISGNAEDAMRRAVLFAGYKIGESKSSKGFLDAELLESLYNQLGQ